MNAHAGEMAAVRDKLLLRTEEPISEPARSGIYYAVTSAFELLMPAVPAGRGRNKGRG